MTINFPDNITINPPGVPNIVMAPPRSPSIVVVPVQGPPGPQGPAGNTGQTLAFTQNVSSPMTSVTINHGLAFRPSGIVCLEADGSPPLIGVGVSYPSVGQVVLTFGTSFTGTIYLS